ncbi:MAG: ribonuclease III family protein [Candidatus Thorarchaeota archaeon]
MIDLEKGIFFEWKINRSLLEEALTHPNYNNIYPNKENFERLEFLGDAILDVLTAEWLYQNIQEDVGVLSKLRSLVVQTDSLSEIGNSLNLQDHMMKEPKYEVTQTDIEDCLEAISGALYLSNDIETTRDFFNKLFSKKLQSFKEKLKNKEERRQLLKKAVCEDNPKNKLQEFCQKRRLDLPSYKVIGREGFDHDPIYHVECTLQYKNKTYTSIGKGKRVKIAEYDAAEDILEQLEESK